MPKTPKRSFKKNIENTKVYYIEKNDDDSDTEDNGSVVIQLPTVVIDVEEDIPKPFIEDLENEMVETEPTIEELTKIKLDERENEDMMIQKKIEELNSNDISNIMKKPYVPFNNKEFDNLKDIKYIDYETKILNENMDVSRISDCIINTNNFHRNKQINIEITKVVDLNQKIVNAIENNIYPTHTDSPCFWCRYTFNDPPIPLVKRYYNNIFYVYDFYHCSFECAEAHRRIYPDKESEAGLLLLLYTELTGDTSQLYIKPALDPRLLKLFNGPLSIEEYRIAHLSIKNYRIINPPLIAIVQQMEEVRTEKQNIISSKNIKKDTNIELFKNPNLYGIPPELITSDSTNKIKSSKSNSELVLKRSKPLPKSMSHSLDSFIKIK